MRRFLILAALVGLAGCESVPVTTRTVAAKSEYDTTELMPMYVGKSMILMPYTEHHYDLTADNGAIVEVGGREYNATKAGETYTGKWREKK